MLNKLKTRLMMAFLLQKTEDKEELALNARFPMKANLQVAITMVERITTAVVLRTAVEAKTLVVKTAAAVLAEEDSKGRN